MNVTWAKKTLLSIIIVLFCSQATLSSKPLRCSEQGIVSWIVDGDTIFVKTPNKTVKVRMLGIDTPEFNKRTGKSEYYSYEAFKYTKEQLKGKKICLVKDSANDRDQYGRLLRYIYLDSRLFNAELIEKGYADIFSKSEHQMKEYFFTLREEARKNKLGMWNSGNRGK